MPQRLKRLHCPIHCTFIVRKCFSLWSPTNTTGRPQYRIDCQGWIEKAPVGGTAVGTVLTLVFLPALYTIWFRVKPTVREQAPEAQPAY